MIEQIGIDRQLVPFARNIGENGLDTLRSSGTSDEQRKAQHDLLDKKLEHGYKEAVLATLYLAHFYPSFSDELMRQVQLGFLLHDVGMSLAGSYWWSNTNEQPLRVNGQAFDHMVNGLKMISVYEKTHPFWNSQPVTRDIVRFHHERLDGTGCKKMEAGSLSFIARLAAVTDQLVSRCEERPYNGTFPRQTLRGAFEALRNEPHRYDVGIVVNYGYIFHIYFANADYEGMRTHGLSELYELALGWK